MSFEDIDGTVLKVLASNFGPDGAMQDQQRVLSKAQRKMVLVRLALMATSLALCSMLPLAHAQTETTPQSSNTLFVPAPGDIVVTLYAQFRVSAPDALKIAQAVVSEARRQSMSPVLLLSVMAVESGFDPRAVSALGARGLMQVLPTAHPSAFTDVKQLDDPAINVRVGSAILRGYINASGGDIDAALSRYSGGEKTYAHRVALHMQRFNVSLRGYTRSVEKVPVVQSDDVVSNGIDVQLWAAGGRRDNP